MYIHAYIWLLVFVTVYLDESVPVCVMYVWCVASVEQSMWFSCVFLHCSEIQSEKEEAVFVWEIPLPDAHCKKNEKN